MGDSNGQQTVMLMFSSTSEEQSSTMRHMVQAESEAQAELTGLAYRSLYSMRDYGKPCIEGNSSSNGFGAVLEWGRY